MREGDRKRGKASTRVRELSVLVEYHITCVWRAVPFPSIPPSPRPDAAQSQSAVCWVLGLRCCAWEIEIGRFPPLVSFWARD